MIDINGHWIGFYNYDKGYSDLMKSESVPFRVTIKKEWDNFVGRLTEEEDYGGIDDEILIKGQLNGDKIEFTKYYTQEHVVYENNESFSFDSDNPTVVHHEGVYDSKNSKFKGRWEIRQLKEIEDGVLAADNNSGLWEMWRA
ncbi:MAG TPA: hypothetical protein PKL56_05910 [Cyclobacteriaceae bacterium]|nr:hypothetical protein [Cyclobacteriaceae bacterium]HMV08410.1 hypothetical protein [Cyclobacteriaceae bacterium]HMX01183.1 hypothetical protein [Cyclobacteriaceae bacterium]HMX50586.1 hypothetical protein [Cyclobacteriaceae bacterium]HMY91985.1 hypothetical protein [Cyclobacteriaceae bacterium]